MSGIVLMFPGQGSQSVGMGRDVFLASPAAAEVYRRADEVLGFPLSEVCFAGPESRLKRTDVQQPAIFVTSVAIWAAVVERHGPGGVVPSVAAGLSLGEYTALHVAGSLAFDDALRLVRRRGELMQEAAAETAGAMVSVIGGSAAQVEALCRDAAEGDVLVPANYNCPGQIVISGTASACRRAVERSSRHGLRAIMLKVAGAFHSPLVARAAEQLAPVLSATPVAAPRCRVIANVDAAAHDDAGEIRDALYRQMTHAVRWQESIEALISEGLDCFVEIGPGRVLTGLMRKINRGVKAVNVSSAADLDLDALRAAAV